MTNLKKIREKFQEWVLSIHSDFGDETAVVQKEAVLDAVKFLRDDPSMQFNFLMDLTAVDYLKFPQEHGMRFEVVYHFYSREFNKRFRIKTPVPENDLNVPSISSLYGVANWMEREVYDMYGISFAGHPDLRRILLFPEFEGYPLRKDYRINFRQPTVPLREPLR